MLGHMLGQNRKSRPIGGNEGPMRGHEGAMRGHEGPMRGPLVVGGPLEAHKGYWGIFKAKIENVLSQANKVILRISSIARDQKSETFCHPLFNF